MIALSASARQLVDRWGEPLVVPAPAAELPLESAGPSSTPRRDGPRDLRASYDAAGESDEFSRYWANADNYDADSANSRSVRATLVARARYEVANNAFADGCVQTYANYLVGLGPTLRMMTGNREFNVAVQLVWWRWAQAIHLRRKLWCLAHAKVQDGEGLAILGSNPAVKHRVQLDLRLIEAEQCATPRLPPGTPGYVDGIRFDAWGNPLYYDILPEHPGARDAFGGGSEPIPVPAALVTHWFLLRRPGQHRAVPEFRSSLNTGAASRRFREATLAAAETAADLNVLLQTQLTPDVCTRPVTPLSTMPIEKRMMTALPSGWTAQHMRSEHPNASYEGFVRSQLNEQARPKSIPRNLATCDSSDYNYASGRLDHQTFFSQLDVEREDCNDLVLEKIFAAFWLEAVREYGWNADPYAPPDHTWQWPRHPVADIASEASASETRLRGGMTTLSRVYADNGLDFDDELEQMAADYGVSTDAMRAILRNAILNAQNQQASMATAAAQSDAAAGDDQPDDEGAVT